jgi:hypothetical protein
VVRRGSRARPRHRAGSHRPALRTRTTGETSSGALSLHQRLPGHDRVAANSGHPWRRSPPNVSFSS